MNTSVKSDKESLKDPDPRMLGWVLVAHSLPSDLDDKTTREAVAATIPAKSTYRRQSKTNEHKSRVSEELAPWRS